MNSDSVDGDSFRSSTQLVPVLVALLAITFCGACSQTRSSDATRHSGSGISNATTAMAAPGKVNPLQERIEDVSVDVAVRLLQTAQDMPTSDLYYLPSEYGGTLSTLRPHSTMEETNAASLAEPQITISRSLDILPDGTDVEGGNQLNIHGSVPVDTTHLAQTSLWLTFTQHSILAQPNDLSIDTVMKALQGSARQNIGFISVAATFRVGTNHPFGGDTIGFNEKRELVYMALGNELENDLPAATTVHIEDVSAKARKVAEMIDSAVRERARSARNHGNARTSYSGTTLNQLGVCTQPCVVTGQVDFVHPTWGDSVLLTVQSSAGAASSLYVLDATSAARWKHDAGDLYELAPAKTAKDKLGHLFINFNPGRYNGVIVLRPVESGFDDFGTLPTSAQYDARFYGAGIQDADQDGVFELVTEENECQPTCAEGRPRYTTYKWNGKDYSAD